MKTFLRVQISFYKIIKVLISIKFCREKLSATYFLKIVPEPKQHLRLLQKGLSADVINLDIATSSQSKGESILDLNQ